MTALAPGNQDMLVYHDGTVGTGLCPIQGGEMRTLGNLRLGSA